MNSISKLQRQNETPTNDSTRLGGNLKELHDCIHILLFQLNKGLKTFLETLRREVHRLFLDIRFDPFIESIQTFNFFFSKI